MHTKSHLCVVNIRVDRVGNGDQSTDELDAGQRGGVSEGPDLRVRKSYCPYYECVQHVLIVQCAVLALFHQTPYELTKVVLWKGCQC